MATSKNNNGLVWGALLLTLAATAWVASQEGSTPAEDLVATKHDKKAERSNVRRNEKPSSDLLLQLVNPHVPSLIKPEWPQQNRESTDLFQSHSWYVPPPPPPPVPPPPPPKPTAPPVPFVYLGKIEDTPSGTQMMLSGNNKVYTVAIGEVIDQVWKLESEDANSLRFIYVPLKLPKVMSKSAKAPAPAAGAEVTQGVAE